jgi:hypothetical protein
MNPSPTAAGTAWGRVRALRFMTTSCMTFLIVRSLYASSRVPRPSLEGGPSGGGQAPPVDGVPMDVKSSCSYGCGVSAEVSESAWNRYLHSRPPL